MRLLLLVALFASISDWICPQESSAQECTVKVSVVDADSEQPIECRIYLTAENGEPYYFQSTAEEGSAFRYENQNWLNEQSIEYHTTVSAHPCESVVPPGQYRLVVERGKTYFPHEQELTLTEDGMEVLVRLKRWLNMSERGWYSGDTHLHRELHELRNIVLAEDLNVVFPLTNWVTFSDTPPSAGDKNLDVNLPNRLIAVDDEHVIWPRNTEYEIFTVGKQRHTLGALFVLGHEGALQQTVPPWKPVIDAAVQADPNVLFDMDKLAWPFAMTLPVLAPSSTYELANNHMWRTEFAFREWYTPTPPFIAPPFGATEGGESEWIDFTLGMYYALLNCGFQLPPSAGTANGVHPVPAGFGRVYVNLPDGFNYESWRKGLREGRSFVTTGPMLFATAADKPAGHEFEFATPEDVGDGLLIRVEVVSETPVTFGEILINGRAEHLIRARQERTEAGAYRAVIEQKIKPNRSGWFAVRFFEDRPKGRVRFAHSAPWSVKVGDQPTAPSREERDYLVDRMRTEMQRSRGIVSEAGMAEYQEALEFYQSLSIADDSLTVASNSRPLTDDSRQRWLENMVGQHRFTADEVRHATGMTIDEARQAIRPLQDVEQTEETGRIRVLPYPGGRHPRRGFLEGAIDPQRETKVSVFPPWADGGYAVVDVPEAIFSNLGLTYLAHTHVPTIWSDQSVRLPKLEWQDVDGVLSMERELPNGIAFGSHVRIVRDGPTEAVAMDMWLRNGTPDPLSGLRSQVCVMLKGLIGFNSLRRRPEKVLGPFAAVKSDKGDRWVITAWQPLHRAWTNPPVPCLHSDPIFPDCPAGQTVHVRGGLWFYEGQAIESELQRLKESVVWQ
ncbi:MAG: hypothetical protein ACR2NZ_10855 [Rubripirellula sp.]